MTISIQEQTARAHAAMAAAGLSDLVWGHVSLRDPAGRGVWMKASGWGFEEVDAHRVVLVAPDGRTLEGDGKRHIEYPIHTEIMAARPDVGAVVHVHAPAIAAFASLDVELRAISHDGVEFADPQVPRFGGGGALIATVELGATLAASIADNVGCLMPQHGAVTVGPDAAHAVMRAMLLERACRAQLMALAAGGPKMWSDGPEIAIKRTQVWNSTQIEAGWGYLIRRAESPDALIAGR